MMLLFNKKFFCYISHKINQNFYMFASFVDGHPFTGAGSESGGLQNVFGGLGNLLGGQGGGLQNVVQGVLSGGLSDSLGGGGGEGGLGNILGGLGGLLGGGGGGDSQRPNVTSYGQQKRKSGYDLNRNMNKRDFNRNRGYQQPQRSNNQQNVLGNLLGGALKEGLDLF